MKILDRYMVRIFLSSYGVVLLFAIVLFLVFDIFGRLGNVLEAKEAIRNAGYSIAGLIASHSLLSIPIVFIQLAPFTTLIAATIALLRLIRSNEVTPMVAAGRSPARIMLPVYVVAGLLSVGMLAMQEWGVPRIGGGLTTLRAMMKGEGEGSYEEIRAVTDSSGNTWSIDRYDAVTRRIEKARVLTFRDPESGEEIGTLLVGSAVWRERGKAGKGWYPRDAVLRPVGIADPVRLPDDRPLDTALLPAHLDLKAGHHSRQAGKLVALSEAARMAREHADLPRLRVIHHSLITWPIANLLLLFLGIPLIFRFRHGKALFGLGIAMGLCAGYFVLDTLFQDLGSRAVIAPALAAWLPLILFGGLAVSMADGLRA